MSIRDFQKKKKKKKLIGGGGGLENIFSTKGGPGRKSLGTTELTRHESVFVCVCVVCGVSWSLDSCAC